MPERPGRHLNPGWFLVQLRWLLYAIALFLAWTSDRAPSAALIALTVVALAYNVALTALAGRRGAPTRLDGAAFLVDLLLIAALVWVTQQWDGPLPLLLLVPVLAASLRYEWRLGVAVALLVCLFWLLTWSFLERAPLSELAAWRPLGYLGLLLCVLLGGAGLARTERARARDLEERARERIRLAEEQIRAVYELTGALTATLDYERVLDAILDVALLGLREIGAPQADTPCMILLFEDAAASHRLQVVASRGLGEAEPGPALLAEEGLLGAMVAAAEPQSTADPARDPELRRFPALHGCRSAVAIPLRAGFELFGALVFASPRPAAFRAEQMMLLTTLGNQAAIALQNARYYRQQEQEKQRIIDGEAEVRRWLARELHDGPTQTISALAMRLSYLRFVLSSEPDRVNAEVDDLEEMARRATREIRTTLFKLRPLTLESQGLRAALEQYALRLQEDEGLALRLDIEELPERLDGKVESAVFSIIEEAINNARKHSEAESISVRAIAYEGALVITVRDNGKGFDLKDVQASYGQRASLGLVSMRERAELLGGTLEIASRPGAGTTVTLALPLAPDS